MEARRKSFEFELQQAIQGGNASELAATAESAMTKPDSDERREEDNERVMEYEAGADGDDKGGYNDDGLAALAEEQRRLEEQDKLEHEAEMDRLKK